ncbi:MAG: flavin-containing monooxygenase [Candidatus Dormibacteria bacterium]
MTETLQPTRAAVAPGEVAGAWLASFGAALEAGDLSAVEGLFLPDGWWRDLLAFTWDLRTFSGSRAIAEAFKSTLEAVCPSRFRLTSGKDAAVVEPAPGMRWIQAFFDFETAVGRGVGFLRLMPAGTEPDTPWKAWTVLTTLDELKGLEEPSGPRRPHGVDHGEHRGRRSWLERRQDEQSLAGGDPAVVVVGAGQGGLTIAARLKQLGVDTLVVERNPRVGDNWRNRYRYLVLHDPVWYDHLPYLPFPAHWPVFTPKDKLADWFESYASAMELNVWVDTEFLGGHYDDGAGRWVVRVQRSDGTERTLNPSHVVLATGMSGVPNMPEIPGAHEFAGVLCHSSAHTSGMEFAGRRAIVVGSGNSGHDIAQDFYEHGADVTLVQRSGTYVMSSENGIAVLFAGLYEEGGPSVEDADLMLSSLPFPLVGQLHVGATKVLAEMDAELLAGLKTAGFKLDFGEDGSGLFMKYLTRGGGYYIDVGASTLIAEGKIKLKQGASLARLEPDGVVFTDGTTLPADVVVLATGYQNMRESARALLGDDVAGRCQPVWDLDHEGELRTIWRRSGHPGLWFMGGNLQQARTYSKFLALQIKAIEEGIIPRA